MIHSFYSMCPPFTFITFCSQTGKFLYADLIKSAVILLAQTSWILLISSTRFWELCIHDPKETFNNNVKNENKHKQGAQNTHRMADKVDILY